MPVPFSFGAATTAIPLSQLDSNFNTPITLGNTAIQLGNTVTTLNNMTLANVTISSGNVTITNVTVTTANATTVNTTTLIATTANVTTINATDINVAANVTLNGGTANGVAYLNGSKVLTTGSALTFDGTTLVTTGKFGITGNGVIPTASALEIGTNSIGTRFRYNVPSGGEHNFTENGLVISFQTANAHGWNTGGSEQMRLTTTGLGIGTSSPSNKLVVSNAGAAGLEFAPGETNGPTIYSYNRSTSAWATLQTFASQQIFCTNGTTERARITSGGDLVVNSSVNAAPLNTNAKLSVWNSAGSSFGIATGYGTSNGQFRLIYLTSGNDSLNFDSGTNNATLSSAGAWTNASDARLKKNIVDIKYGLADVLKTQPRSYEMNNVEGEYIGFVAQELQKVIPEVVSGDPEKQLGVDYGSLVALAFKAIQELKAEFDAYKATHP